MQTDQRREYALVYQCGLANVFRLREGREPLRVAQNAFEYCEALCAGLTEMGAVVRVHHCDVAGDCRLIGGARGPGEMFADKKRLPV